MQLGISQYKPKSTLKYKCTRDMFGCLSRGYPKIGKIIVNDLSHQELNFPLRQGRTKVSK